METLQAAQHLFSSVERGFFPKQGRGFQTVAVTPELMGTEDLRVLEEVAFYTLSRERRATEVLPIKETFLQLPSEKFAMGRTIYLGVDAMGREGNYLSHHLIFNPEDLLVCHNNPFVIFGNVIWADQNTDLKPRELPKLPVAFTKTEKDEIVWTKNDALQLAHLALSVLERSEKTTLLVGAEADTRELLKKLFLLLPLEDRLRATFATHFYESDHLRQYFSLATVSTAAEIPAQSAAYTLIDLQHPPTEKPVTVMAYAQWLVDVLWAGNFTELAQVNQALQQLQNNETVTALPASPAACAALWERAGVHLVPALIGDAALITRYFTQLKSSQSLADALLQSSSPTMLCGVQSSENASRECLALLQSSATKKVWKEWCKRWQNDARLAEMLQNSPVWWQFWK